jgi:hypothetical protein
MKDKGDNHMSYNKMIFLGIFLFIFCLGCGLTESVVQKEQKSYLAFTGSTEGAVVYIDNLDPIYLNQSNKNNTQKGSKINYEISPGKHKIVIKKSGKEVVNRDLLLGNGIVKEIEIP